MINCQVIKWVNPSNLPEESWLTNLQFFQRRIQMHTYSIYEENSTTTLDHITSKAVHSFDGAWRENK